MSPLSTFKYTIKNTSAFIAHTKRQNIPKNFKLISFDVTSLFTNVPSDFTIDVILKRIIIPRDYEIETKVYRKSSNNDIYVHWQSFYPTTWKWGTLWTLISRVFRMLSNDQHLKNEIRDLKKVLRVFRNSHGYPNWEIEQTIKKWKIKTRWHDQSWQQVTLKKMNIC